MNTQYETSFTQQDWERYALCYDRLNELTPYKDMLREVSGILDRKDNEHVLDAACGTGNLTMRFSSGTTPLITGCDYSAEMLARAKEKCGSSVQIVRANFNHPLPFADDSFDALACVNTLYAIDRPAHLLKEFFRVLKKGGRMVLVTPKAGYENGLILKEHCKSPKPDAHWERVHLDPAREEARIREACGDTELSHDLILVGTWNRFIFANSRFHFFTKEALEDLIANSGFIINAHRMTYAHQCHLISVTKPVC